MDLRLSFGFVRLSATALTVCMVLQWMLFSFGECNGQIDWADEDDDPGKFCTVFPFSLPSVTPYPIRHPYE